MESEVKVQRQPNHRKGANILSIITFWYTFPTFRKGFRKELQEEDIPEHLDAHDSKKLGDRLDAAWQKELRRKNPSLYKAILTTFGWEFGCLGFILIFIELVIKIAQPLALPQLIRYFNQTRENGVINESQALLYASVIVGASVGNVLGGHSYMLGVQHFGMKLRVAFCSVIYRKSLRLSKAVLGGTTIGQMVNLLSNDVSRCDRAIIHVHNLWMAPIETIIIVGLLSYLVGPLSAVGVLFLALFVPLQMYFGKKTSMYRLKTAFKTDERIRLMNEIISGIQVIKMYTWEKPFTKLVAIVRRLEIRHIRGTSYIRGFIISFSIFTSKLAVFITILTYVLLGNTPTAEYVFVVSSFYNVLRQAMTMHFPRGIAEIAELHISISRLQKFLLYEEVKLEEEFKKPSNCSLKLNNKKENGALFVHIVKNEQQLEPTRTGNVGIQLKNASAKWTSASPEDTLHEVNFKADSGQLVAIIGPVGSGKTSLLHVILRELPLLRGQINVNGKVSYTSQEPWVFAGSIRQNILFGLPINAARYQEVLRTCALDHDLSSLPYGDETIVGEKGVTLSGGQKARVSLARAVYKDVDIYLLDDPLSAVDTHVGKYLFEECISGFLKNKCTILVTHQLQYLRNVSDIYLIKNGCIATHGTYEKLKDSGIDFTAQFHESSEEENNGSGETSKQTIRKIENKPLSPQMEIKEHRSTGSVSRDVYKSYFKSGGNLFTGLSVLSLFVLSQLTNSGSEYFLTYWVNLEQKTSERNNTNTKFIDIPRETCLYIYSGIVGLMVVVTLYRSYYFFTYCMKASIRLHNDMFSNIVQAPMRFFNTNSSGRILNRFSKDMGAIDEILPIVTIDCIQVMCAVVGITVVVSLVNPWLLIVTAIILTIFYILRIIYMRSSRNIKRLEGITRSPVFAYMNASLHGLTTIRAFGAQSALQQEFDNHQNLHSSVWYWFISCSRAFGFWLDFICVFYIASVTYSFFIMEEHYGGNVGLAITQAISLTGMFQWGMRQWTELENQMTSVERVVEYTKIEHEKNPQEVNPQQNWPIEGNISFNSVSLRYSPTDPYILNRLTFNIKAKEKVGIVGRTGAGKSTLIYALFQLTPTEGVISIDGIDVGKIPLECLRSRISIIPQEPVLFSGTLKKNLDPFDEYPDADLWNALEEVELKNVVAELPAQLHDKMSEGGSNFSVGQRQLICLARAIIRKNKLLVLDEATANVDPQTDALIQKTIRRKFADCTVLTIAHRLHTIMDSDKVLVMDAGSAVEFDHPYVLLQNQYSLFYSMVQQTGPSTAENLARTAENDYKEKIGRAM